ncbi:MAG: ankyrin repeat domain-containing protein [Planctomycetes bacterium]|jgi:ankyrin repeat protein|nr:ankyrin repeat domain-containing protein [Planctomycetota bacterium]
MATRASWGVAAMVAIGALRAQQVDLRTVVCNDDAAALALLLREQPALRAHRLPGGWPLLNLAAIEGAMGCVRVLLAAKAPVDSIDERGRTPAQWAAEQRHTAILRLLREHGARTDLCIAMALDDVAWVKQWLAENLTEVPWEAQVTAAEVGATESLRLVLPRAAPRPENPFEGASRLVFHAVAHADTLAMLLDSGEPIDACSAGKFGGSTLLHDAAASDAGASIDLLLARGMQVDVLCRDGSTPLQMAVFAVAIQATQTLIAKGASLQRGPELLTLVCSELVPGRDEGEGQRRRRLAQVLLDHGVPLDVFAAISLDRHADLRRLLAAEPAAVNRKRQQPWLVRAARCADVEAVRILLDAGADVAAAEKGGYTALHWAAFLGVPECVELLLARGAPVSPPAGNGLTPLHESVRCGHPALAARLLRAGADREAKDHEGKRPLDHAEAAERAEFEAVFAARD